MDSSNLVMRYQRIEKMLNDFSIAFVLERSIESIYFEAIDQILYVCIKRLDHVEKIPFNCFDKKNNIEQHCFDKKIHYSNYAEFFDFFIDNFHMLSIIGTPTFLGMQKFESLSEVIDWKYIVTEIENLRRNKIIQGIV